jgi:hypothetical protein
VDLFGRTFRSEERATKAIQEAATKWANIEDIVNAIEWNTMHDPLVGNLLNERGLRGYVAPRARSRNEPDVGVIYQENDPLITIHLLVFREAKAHYAGRA